MNRQGNFPEPNDLQAQKALERANDHHQNNLSDDNTQNFWNENPKRTAESGEGKKTMIQEELSEDSLDLLAQEVEGLSLEEFTETGADLEDLGDLENLELTELNLLDSTIDNTQNFWNENPKVTTESGDGKKTMIQEELAEDSLDLLGQEVESVSLEEFTETEADLEDLEDLGDLENLELTELNLLDSTIDNTQDLLPFIDQNVFSFYF